MIAPDVVAVILLAAGASRRFGSRDKLAEPLGDLPLGLHAATMLDALPFAAKIAVTRAGGPDFASAGFTPVVNPDPDAGQSGSIRLGLAEALRAEPRAVLVALADMPFVTVAHVEALLACLDEWHPVVGSTDAVQAGPPVIFGASQFARLRSLTGDAGARALLGDAALIAAPAAELADIDTPDDLPAGTRCRHRRRDLPVAGNH